jgi:hypothetical protein
MTSRPSPAAPILAVLAIVLVTLGAYVGGYVALVERGSVDWDSVGSHRTLIQSPKYRFGGAFSKTLFAPAHALDMILRPKYWEVSIGPAREAPEGWRFPEPLPSSR